MKLRRCNIFIMIMISKFLLRLTNFCVIVCFSELTTNTRYFIFHRNAVFVAKLLIYGISFSNSVTFVFLTKSFKLGIIFSNSVLSVRYLVFKTNALVSIFLLLIYHTLFFYQHHFLLHYSVYSNQQELVLICPCLVYQV